jgi:hypothetical protein
MLDNANEDLSLGSSHDLMDCDLNHHHENLKSHTIFSKLHSVFIYKKYLHLENIQISYFPSYLAKITA